MIDQSSSIYFYSISSQLKIVIDRTYAFFSQLAGKTFYYVITCAGPDVSFAETMIASLKGFTCCVPEAKEGGILIAPGTNDAGDVKGSEAMKQAYEMGKSVNV